MSTQRLNQEEIEALKECDNDVEKGEASSPDTERKRRQNPPDTTLSPFQSSALALIYMLGSITFYIFIRYSKKKEIQTGEHIYDSAAAVFFTELLKWIFCVVAMMYRENVFLPVSVLQSGSWRIGMYYAVPSGIYALYNNLTYYNLTWFDPGTYQVFMQTRVLFTGVLYSYILSRTLTRRKWLALVLLTLGVVAKNYTPDLQIDGRIAFMLFQASLSAFAGVYNEFLLKDNAQMDVNEQNFFMYSWALLFNLSWGYYSNPTYYTSGQVFRAMNNGLFTCIVINGAILGIVTSLILKFINVIVKAFASACEVLLTAVIAYFSLGDPLTGKDLVACVVVMYSIYVYYGTGPILPWTRWTILEPSELNSK